MTPSVSIFLRPGLFLCLCLAAFVQPRAQSFSEDLAKVKARFSGNAPIKATLTVNYYRNGDEARPSLSKRGLLKKSGSDYYSFFDGKEYLINKKYTLFVDRGRKIMLIKKTDASVQTRNKELSVPELNPAEESKYRIDRNVSDDRVTYTVTAKANPESRFALEMDQNGSRLTRVTYFGGNSYARTEVIYIYAEKDPVFSKTEFSELRYLSPSKNTFVPTAEYAGYELNDQTR